MGAPSYGPMFPSTAFWLSLIGGFLIALGGIAAIIEGTLFRSRLESIVPGSSGVAVVEGGVGLVFGIVIIFGALRLKTAPQASRFWGIIITVFAIISLFGGGGFLFVGLILALIGGILAMTWHPPVMPQPVYGPPGYLLPTNRPTPTGTWGPPASPPVGPGTAQRFCAFCGSPNVASAQFCAKCGASMR